MQAHYLRPLFHYANVRVHENVRALLLACDCGRGRDAPNDHDLRYKQSHACHVRENANVLVFLDENAHENDPKYTFHGHDSVHEDRDHWQPKPWIRPP